MVISYKKNMMMIEYSGSGMLSDTEENGDIMLMFHQNRIIFDDNIGYIINNIMVQGNCDEAARCYALANAAQSEWPQVG